MRLPHWVLLFTGLTAAAPALAEPDDVYRRLSHAFETLDVEVLDQVYTEDAVYLGAGNDPIARGLDEIAENFAASFKVAKENGIDVSMNFKVLHRSAGDDHAHDVGLLHWQESGGASGAYYGRFMTVLRKGEDGQWRIAGNAETDATKAIWEAADKAVLPATDGAAAD